MTFDLSCPSESRLDVSPQNQPVDVCVRSELGLQCELVVVFYVQLLV